MFSTSQRMMAKALLPVVAVLFLFSKMGQTAILTNSLQTTSPPAVTNSSLDMHPSNKSSSSSSNIKSPRPCSSENASYCLNGGKCVYHQDNTSPSCICQSSYSGERCMDIIISDLSFSYHGTEQLIGIIIGIIMMLFILAIIIFCCYHKRCVKSAPLKKPAPETRV